MKKEAKRTWLEEIKQLSQDSELSEEDLILVEESSKPEKEDVAQSTALVLSLKDTMVSFGNILTTIEVKCITFVHAGII